MGAVPTDAALNKLCELDVNGREIKNLVKMAKLLAKNQGDTMGIEHVKDVIEVIENPTDD